MILFINVMSNARVLFIVKERKVYGTKTTSYGLVNSCQFIVNVLNEHGIESKVVQVIDNNYIDKEVTDFKPTHCFIEALWVVPEKFEVLSKLHPTVKWTVRLHSMIPFLVSEGMSFDWIDQYEALRTEKGINIYVSCNNNKLFSDLRCIYSSVEFAPNIYYPDKAPYSDDIKVEKGDNILNIGCFGALRILKNHCQQAVWAIEFADKHKKKLNFHVNVSNYETDETCPVLKNLRAIFKRTNHTLFEHMWLSHQDFITLVSQMDFGMQISFTETFNIVAADFVHTNVPVVVSTEIDFVNSLSTVNPSNRDSILNAMNLVYGKKRDELVALNRDLLNSHNIFAKKIWLSHVK
jgi:hypothetical protein